MASFEISKVAPSVVIFPGDTSFKDPFTSMRLCLILFLVNVTFTMYF